MSQYDVLCIGNAIVDIIARCDEAFITGNGIVKGAMNLIDAERAELLYSRMGPAIEASGGSAGNTAAGVASFGGRAAYFGKVAKDHLGHIYTHDIRAQGVAFDTRPLDGPPPTARSMIFVTPDGERSMNTYLGACVELGPEDVEADKAQGAKVTYFEGYLWDPPRAKEAIRLTAAHTHAGGGEVARYAARTERGRVAKAILIAAIPPVMVKSERNPDGIPPEVFDAFRSALYQNRAQFYRDVASGTFYGFNREGAKVSQGLIDNWWRQGMAGGGLQTPGVMGVGKYYLLSRKFISADGGFKRVVWMSSVLKETMAEELKAVCEREGDPDLLDKIADERSVTTVEELIPFLEEHEHPALSMDPIF